MCFAIKLGDIAPFNKQGSIFLQVKDDQSSITGLRGFSTIQKEEKFPHTQFVTEST